jgi:hypothetical protein
VNFQAMICPEAVRLFDLYQEALTRFHAARLGFPDAEDYEASFSKLGAARSQYWSHIEEHGCRMPPVATEPADIEEQLRADVQRAWAAYEEAAETCRHRLETAGYPGETSDGEMAHEQAIRHREEALLEYRAAFRRFADYLMDKRVPEDIGG